MKAFEPEMKGDQFPNVGFVLDDEGSAFGGIGLFVRTGVHALNTTLARKIVTAPLQTGEDLMAQ
jgi:hypothetical protein